MVKSAQRLDRLTSTLLSGFLMGLLLVGCGKQPPEVSKKGRDSEPQSVTNDVAADPKAAVVAKAGDNEKTCFECSGEGTVVCRGPGCVNGKTDCPGSCLKLTKGAWVHMNVPGHDPKELWQKFPDGTGGYQAWTQGHLGEAIVIQNGAAVNMGPCKVCGGSTKVDCPVCKGQGKRACEICGGRKFIPVAWTATDNPWFNKQPDLIRLQDGRVLLGKVAASNGDELIVRLRDGKVLHISKADIVTKR